ncbi:S24 family peptidase [Pseudomonas sp. RC10]|uniref:LexA family transcriptional regulator n=1 Tax=Pseudomonas bambusae TaxID=3139142 RepID=UPI0031397896
MIDDLAGRIRQCAEIAGSGDELARLTGIPRRTLEYYLIGQSEPKIGRCVEIAKAVGVDVGWLATGEGVQFHERDLDFADDGGHIFLSVFDAHCGSANSGWPGAVPVIEQLVFTAGYLKARNLNSETLAAIKVEGDSMSGLLNEGDTLMFDRSRSRLEGEAVYVIRLNDRLQPKRLQRRLDGSVQIISENNSYRDIVVPEEGLTHLDILGRVVWAGGWM